jgi:PAS domain S-box-containing protein
MIGRLRVAHKLLRGFKAMLDRLQTKAGREKKLAARERAAAAQREIFETMPVWLAVVRRSDGAILHANRALGAQMDDDAGGGQGAHLMDRLHEADRERLIGRLGREDRFDGAEARLVLADRRLFWVLVSARSLTYGGEHCALLVFTPADDLKRAEMERERLASRLVDAIESLAEGFALYDDTDRLIACNEPYRAMNETVRDLLQPGARWADLVRAGLERGQFADLAGREEAWLADRLQDRADPGKAVDVKLASGQWLRAVDRRTREGGLVSIRADVTEEKLSAERLRTSEAFKSAIINASLESIVTIDAAGRILEFNPAAERTFGFTRDQVLGRSLDGLIIPERLGEAHRRGLARFLETGESKVVGRRLEIAALRADGTEFPIELAVTEVALEGRRAFTAYLRDITRRVSAEAELARRASLLEAVGHSATEIVGDVEWQRSIPDLLRRLGLAAEVSRVTLFEAHRSASGRLVQSCRHDWAEAGLAPLSDDPRYLEMPLTGDDGEEVGAWTLRRQRGEVVQATLSETTGYTRRVFEEHGTLSFLSVPIMVSGEWWGFFGFDDCKTERVWTDVEIDVLKTSAALIAGAIERARAAERLRLSEQRYALAARGANDGLWDWDVAGNTAYFSPRLHEILGLAERELGSSPSALFDRVCEEDLSALQKMLESRFAQRRRKFEIECRMRHQSGGERWMVWRGMIVHDANGPIRVVGSLHDITERKEAEAKLRESEARFRELAEDAPVLLDLMDAQNKLVFANRRYLEFIGRSLEEVVVDGWMAEIHPEDLPRVIEFGDRQLARRGEAEIEYRARRHDGEYRWMRLTETVRRGADGAFAGFVDAMVDVTDRKRAEAEVARQRDALHQSEKLTALGSLLAGVAHELNNPLSVVVGQAMLLEETAIDPKVVGRSETIRRAAERCSRIVRTFLTLVRQRQPEQSLVDLNMTIAMATELLAYQLRISDIELKLDLAADLPEVLADSDQLHQVVTNLIVNAEQALAEAGRPRRLGVSTRADQGRRMVVLAVADNGPGIGADIRPRIFEPFFTTKPPGQGTGIGLAMCRNVVSAHRGTLWLENTPGGGATFVVELPLPSGEAPAKPAPAAAAMPGPSPARYRVLVVDDEAEIAQTLAEILKAAGHEVDTAGNGEQALDQLDRETFDVILSDLRMPVLDGPGLFAALRERHPALVDRIAFITGDTLSARLGKFLADTGVLCIEKPFTPDDVRYLLAQVMAQPVGAA